MKSPVISHNNIVMKGFTIIELLLVMGLITIVAAITAPVGISFYKAQLISDVSENVTDSLRRAQAYATGSRNDSSYGVQILPNEYVLFEGSSYASRVVSEDEIFYYPETVIITGFDEIIFSKVSGEPSEVGTLTFTLGNRIKYVELTPAGNIEY